MIYVTGDTHGLININKLIVACKCNKINENDYIIIAGDFGCVWDMESLSRNISAYELFPCKILFVDGNHENFDVLSQYPEDNWCGGRIHRISKKIIHLMRGQIFSLDGITILTIGGADSSDKEYRTPSVSWWSAEAISKADIKEAKFNLSKYNYTVDYIISHTCAETNITKDLLNLRTDRIIGNSEILLNEIETCCMYKKWLFGHWHTDMKLNDRVQGIYNNVVKL